MVVRSALCMEIFGINDAYDSSIVFRHDIKNIRRESMNIKVLTDSETIIIVIICTE